MRLSAGPHLVRRATLVSLLTTSVIPDHRLLRAFGKGETLEPITKF